VKVHLCDPWRTAPLCHVDAPRRPGRGLQMTRIPRKHTCTRCAALLLRRYPRAWVASRRVRRVEATGKVNIPWPEA
jgi:hypothetical protein